MSSYHGQIINLPATPPPDVTESPVKDIRIAYKTGHRDARHAAAELAAQADARIEELKAQLAAANERIAGLEDKVALAEQVCVDMRGRLSSASDLLAPNATNHTTGCGDPNMDVWEFGDSTKVGDSVAISPWHQQRGTHFCADMAKITKVTPLRIEVTVGSAGYPAQYWRKHGEAVGNRGVRAARPGSFDWEIYRAIQEKQDKASVTVKLDESLDLLDF